MVALRIALVVTLLGVACTTSNLDPEEDVVIGGVVTRQDGTPVAGAPVSFWKQPDAGEALGTLFSFGTFCLAEDLPSACESARTTSTGARGHYRFELTGRDTQGTGRSASTLEVTTHLEPGPGTFGGPVTSLRFIAQVPEIDLPLVAWEPTIAARVAGREIRVRWDALAAGGVPPGTGPADARTSVRFETAPEAPVWNQVTAGSGATVDARALEDVRGTMSVAAEGDDIAVAERRGTRLGFTVRSARVPFQGTAGTPASRGARCSTGARPAPGRTIAPCPFTDGNFGRHDDAHGRAVVIDLARAAPIRLVVVRGCARECRVHASPDGSNWRALGRAVAPFTALPADGTDARYVRVRTDDVGELTEVSVWDRSASPARGSILVTPEVHRAETGARPPGGALDPSGGFPWVIVVVVASIALLAFVIGRRSRRPA